MDVYFSILYLIYELNYIYVYNYKPIKYLLYRKQYFNIISEVYIPFMIQMYFRVYNVICIYLYSYIVLFVTNVYLCT